MFSSTSGGILNRVWANFFHLERITEQKQRLTCNSKTQNEREEKNTYMMLKIAADDVVNKKMLVTTLSNKRIPILPLQTT